MKGFEYVLAKMQGKWTFMLETVRIADLLWRSRDHTPALRRLHPSSCLDRDCVKRPQGFCEYFGVINPARCRPAGETPSRTLAETATERARETALAAKEKAKDLASHAQKKQYV